MFKAFCRSAWEYILDAYDWCNEHRKAAACIACLAVGLALGLGLSSKARAAEEFDASKIQVKCDDTDCMMAKKDLAAVSAHYNALVTEVATLRAKPKCGKYNDA